MVDLSSYMFSTGTNNPAVRASKTFWNEFVDDLEDAINDISVIGTPTAASIAELRSISADTAFLAETGKVGLFKSIAGNYSAHVTADPTMWIYIPPTGETGSLSAWVRQSFPVAVPTTQTGTSYTAAMADAQGYIRFTNASSITFTIPPNSSIPFPVGTEITFEQAGAGALSVAAGSGVTINSRASDLTLAGQYAVAAVKKVDTDTWTLGGDM